jgi:hypothetical protein
MILGYAVFVATLLAASPRCLASLAVGHPGAGLRTFADARLGRQLRAHGAGGDPPRRLASGDSGVAQCPSSRAREVPFARGAKYVRCCRLAGLDNLTSRAVAVAGLGVPQVPLEW